MPGRLEKKVCVVTGTGGSMGRATALAFAREGASVVGCDVAVEQAEETVEMVKAAGGKMVSCHPCHLTDPAECAALVDLAVRTFGRIDVLFNERRVRGRPGREDMEVVGHVLPGRDARGDVTRLFDRSPRCAPQVHRAAARET
jgi:NAD(P)-dependent dehydrogenase (short-subunit alcohol dehydrogenase family)